MFVKNNRLLCGSKTPGSSRGKTPGKRSRRGRWGQRREQKRPKMRLLGTLGTVTRAKQA